MPKARRSLPSNRVHAASVSLKKGSASERKAKHVVSAEKSEGPAFDVSKLSGAAVPALFGEGLDLSALDAAYKELSDADDDSASDGSDSNSQVGASGGATARSQLRQERRQVLASVPYHRKKKEKRKLMAQLWQEKIADVKQERQREQEAKEEKSDPVRKLTSLERALPDLDSLLADLSGGGGGGSGLKLSRRQQAEQNKALRLQEHRVVSRKGRQHTAVAEAIQLKSVLSHPSFKTDALGAVTAHLKQTIGTHAVTAGAGTKASKGATSGAGGAKMGVRGRGRPAKKAAPGKSPRGSGGSGKSSATAAKATARQMQQAHKQERRRK